MSKASELAPLARRLRVARLWTLKGLLAAVFPAAAAAKLIGDPMMVSEFGMLGLSHRTHQFGLGRAYDRLK